MRSIVIVFRVLLASAALVFIHVDAIGQEVEDLSFGRLIPATATMVTAWDIPRNPVTDSTLEDSPRTARIRRGYELFMQTPREAPRFTGNKISCGNCHLNGGQRELALPLIGTAGTFPEYNNRAAREFTLKDRIVGCFMRSENATGSKSALAKDQPRTYPDTGSAEVVALAEYITWLSEDVSPGEEVRWRKRNVISPENLLPVENLDPTRGKKLFLSHCSACHGTDGQGVQIGDKKAGPLWGTDSWNDGAGAARVYTLAGFIRYAMPYLNPGSLTDEEAQHIASYITSMARPEFPFKDQDYRVAGVPMDAVYYLKLQQKGR